LVFFYKQHFVYLFFFFFLPLVHPAAHGRWMPAVITMDGGSKIAMDGGSSN
jgi:hypothetical protein